MSKKNELMKGRKGITLIALVITIIVLLILAGVSIAMLTGDNGILKQANKAKSETSSAKEDEETKLKQNEDYITESLINWDTVSEDIYKLSDDGVLSIKDKETAKKYTNIKIPSEINGTKITTIDERGFECFTNLKNVIIPEGITELKEISFNSCTSLEYIKLPQSLTKIGSLSFQNCPRLKEIIIPDNVTNIESFAFADCIDLKTVKLGKGLKEIGTQAFGDTGIQTITIPSNVEKLGWGVFEYCKNLENIYIESPSINFGGDVFGSKTYRIKAGSTIYVRNSNVASLLKGNYNEEDTVISENYNW